MPASQETSVLPSLPLLMGSDSSTLSSSHSVSAVTPVNTSNRHVLAHSDQLLWDMSLDEILSLGSPQLAPVNLDSLLAAVDQMSLAH